MKQKKLEKQEKPKDRLNLRQSVKSETLMNISQILIRLELRSGQEKKQ